MSAINKAAFFIVLGISSLCLAEADHGLSGMNDAGRARPLGDKERAIYLVDFKTKELIPVKVDKKTGKPLIEPYRLYRRFEPRRNDGEGAWVYDIVLNDNKISDDPPQFLAPNSTLPGSWVGLDDSVHVFYRGDKKGFDGFEVKRALSSSGSYWVYEWGAKEKGEYEHFFNTKKEPEKLSNTSNSIPAHRQ